MLARRNEEQNKNERKKLSRTETKSTAHPRMQPEPEHLNHVYAVNRNDNAKEEEMQDKLTASIRQ